MLWLVLALMTVLALLLLLWPLFGSRAVPSARRDFDLAVYRRQLEELESEAARGVIEEAEVEGARIEIERRILRVSERPESAGGGGSWRRPVQALILLVLPLAAFLLYHQLGSPGQPGAPFAGRQASHAGTGGQAVPEVVAKLAARLQANPNDAPGWQLLGRSYMSLRHYADAATAFSQALALNDADNQSRVDRGEALVMSAQGTVTPAARVAFEAAHAREPGNPRAVYYLGLAAWQAQRPQSAYDRWLGLIRSAPREAPWLKLVFSQLSQVAAELSIDLASELPEDLLDRLREPTVAARGPSPEDMAAAAEMSAGDRAAFIRSMVDRLAARLAEAPDDFDGWMRLAKSYGTLGETEQALVAYGKASGLAPDDPAPLAAKARLLIDTAKADAALPEAAIQAYRGVLSLDPEHSEALWFTGLADAKAGDLQAAVRARERLLPKFDPASAEYQSLQEQLSRARQELQ